MVLSAIDEYPDFMPDRFATKAKFKKMMLDLTNKTLKIENKVNLLYIFVLNYKI